MAQRYGTPELMKLMVRQAQHAAQGTGAPLDGTALAAVLGRAVAAEGLRRGETMTRFSCVWDAGSYMCSLFFSIAPG